MKNLNQQANGALVLSEGKDDLTLDVRIRAIAESDPMTGRTIALDRFINVMLDKRAPGLWTGLIGGPKSKMEHLAEITVKHNLVSDIAEALLDHTLIRKVNEKIVRANQRMKREVYVIDYISLLKAVSFAVGATTSATDPRRILARVITELLSKAYLKLSVMTPFVGAAQFERFEAPLATTDTIIQASDVALVTDVFESIELGAAFKDVKEFDPRIAETLLGPLLVTAANRLLNAVRYSTYMRTAAVLVSRWMCQAENFPAHLRDDPNIRSLASNFSFAFGALRMIEDPIVRPDFELREALEYTAMRIRELNRFETISLERFQQMYTHELVRAPSGYVCGVIVTANELFEVPTQVTKFVERQDFTIQCQVEVAEAYLKPITEAITRAFTGGLLARTLHVAAQHVLTRRWELATGSGGAVGFIYNVSVDEEYLYALTFATRIYLTDIVTTANGQVDPPRIVMEMDGGKMFYEPIGWLDADSVFTTDPLEVLILSNADHEANALQPLRPQIIPADMRSTILDAPPLDVTIDLHRRLELVLPLLNDKKLAVNTSLQELLGISGLGNLELTISATARRQVTNSFAALCYMYDELKQNGGEVDQLLAHQVANATHALIARVGAAEPFRRLLLTLHAWYMQDAQFKYERSTLRAHLSGALVQHHMVLNTAMMVLIRTGVLEFGLHENLKSMFATENVVETAVTSEQWLSAMKPVL